jgi:hypothetical protein
MREFVYIKLVDAGKLHKYIADAGYGIVGIVYDSGLNQVTVRLLDSETRDPTSLVNSYVYTAPVIPDYPVLYANAQQTVQDALVQYNTAVGNYTTALTSWNSYGATVTSGNALNKLTACENMVVACASAIQAARNSIGALVDVVTILAKNNSLQENE